MASTSKRTTPKKTGAAKKTAAKKAGAVSKQAQAKKLTAKKKVDAAVQDIEASREAARDLEVTEAGAWKGAVAREATKLLLPSGNVCLAFNEGLMAFLDHGDVPNPLMPILMKAMQGEGTDGKDLKQMMEGDKGAEFLEAMMEMVDSVTVRCVRKPEIRPAPLAVRTDSAGNMEKYKLAVGEVGQTFDGTRIEREAGVLYVDMLDLNDKMFLFQWVMGGSQDIERFRDESAAALAAL